MKKTNIFKISGGLKIMNDIKLQDEYAREKIINDLDTNLLVEAGAGSGKTSSLVKRIIALITTGKYKISEIAAITFTKKAASELMERLLTELEKKYVNETDPDKSNNLLDAINNFDQCFTGTIHSFCSGILRERPVEAGVDPDFDEIDDSDEINLIAETWNEFVKKAKTENRPKTDIADRIGILPEELQETFQKLNNYPEVIIHTDKADKPSLEPALKEVLEVCRQAYNYIPGEEPSKGYDAFQSAVRYVLKSTEIVNIYKEKHTIDIIKKFENSPDVTLNRWNDKDIAKEFRDNVLPDLANNILEPLMKNYREYLYPYFVDLFTEALQFYQDKRNSESILNYNDLLTLTSNMLRTNAEVREYFQDKYKTILVDEFQDTDPIQAEIIMYLTGKELDENDWSKLSPKNGSLFVVGDPKQSIYRFRRADIDIYNAVKDIIKTTGGEVLELTSNFRSLPSIADYLNPVFEEKLFTNNDKYQAPMAKIQTTRENEYEHGVKKLIVNSESKNKKEVVEADAEKIAKYIKHAVDGGIKLARNEDEISRGLTENPEFSDFLIITMHKDSLEKYAEALEKYGIPSTVTGNYSLSQYEEVRQLYKLLKLLNKPDDEIQLVSVLRGLFFGLSDNDLYKFKSSKGHFNIYSRIPDELEDSIRITFENSFVRLRQYKKWIDDFPPSSALEKIVQDLGILPFTSMGSLSKSRASNIYFLIEQIKQRESQEIYSLDKIIRHVGNLLDSGSDQRSSLEAESNSVRIMNLHKAKGLEAPVVFLAHPYKNTRHEPLQHINRRNGKPTGYFALAKKKGQFHHEVFAQPTNWEKIQTEEQKFLDAEFDRLIYVAATRAKNLLIISSYENNKNNKNPWLGLLGGLCDDDILPDVEVEEDYSAGDSELTKSNINKKMEEINKWHSFASDESYVHKRPTEIKDAEKIFAGKRLEGGGQDWGTAVHSVLEFLVINRNNDSADLENFIKMTLYKLEINTDKTKEMREIIDRFKNSGLWQRISEAEKVETEVPITIKVKAGSELFSYMNNDSGSKPIILSGVIDLAFKENGKWVIIDYKTDRVENEAYDNLRKSYQQQVDIYAKAWEEITGEVVKEKSVFFV